MFAANTLAFAVIWHGLGGFLAKPSGIIAFLFLCGAVAVAFTIDAVRVAARSVDYRVGWTNRWWAYVGVAILVVAQSFTPSLAWYGSRRVRTFNFTSSSGEPNLVRNDIATADMWAYIDSAPARGDLAVVEWGGRLFAFRILGLPEDSVQTKDGIPIINGLAASHINTGTYNLQIGNRKIAVQRERETLPDGKSFTVLNTEMNGMLDNTPEVKVPPGHYFLMGDNRDNTADSRLQSELGLGLVGRSRVLGRLETIIWSGDWNRMFRPLN